MESLQLPSKMPADYTRNNRNRIIPAGFVDGAWWAIHGGDSCCSPRHGARGKWQCLHRILGCAGGKWLSLSPELHRAASYLIRGAPVRKPCRMKPHLHIYLPSFKTTEGTTKKLENAAATPSPCSRFHLRRRPRSHHQSSLRHREWQCLLRAVINRLFWFLPPSLPL